MWTPLHVHSQYSILNSTASVEEIAAKAAVHKMEAVALTDKGNLYGAIDFYKACQDAKLKPIIGAEVYVASGRRQDKKKDANSRASYTLVLLAKNKQGYHNLCKLTSTGFIDGFYYTPRIDEAVLKEMSEGLICLSGCLKSRLAHEVLHGSKESLQEQIRWYHSLFGSDYYIELQRHQSQESDILNDGMMQESWLYQQYQDYIRKQTKVNEVLIDVAKEMGVAVAATNNSHYMERADWKPHEILLNVQSGEPCEIWEKDSYGNPKVKVSNPKRDTFPSHEFYFKTQEEMQDLFSDIPESLSNTLQIANACNLTIDFKTKHYPVYTPPDLIGKEVSKEERALAVQSFLWKLCEEGIAKRYTPERLAKVQEIYPGKDPMQVVRDRLSLEMSVIAPKEMSDYLLIVWDFINWAKSNGIPMGPGRGSGAGSIVLYLIGITDIEPLRFHLFFERFINPERISYPDIDVDICMDKRSLVINYTLQKYGKENVAQIITFGTMKAKMSIKDVGRVLSVPLTKVNEIAKLIPEDLNITLDKALEKEPDLRQMYENDEEARQILDIGRKLEGSIRNTGIHAAGIIISGEPLTNHIPICNAKDSEMPVTQYSMKPVELVGMLKVDFLGLKTLTAIQICVDAIKASQNIEIDWINLPLDDAPTFDLLNQGKTLGLFQLESGGMQDLARQLHLDKFEEIIAVGALYRPGPMDMIPSFINRKHGKEPIEYDHPWMKDILSETYGIMVYQEQVMQIASRLAKYSLGEGDVLRRAMGKKDAAQMAEQREKFRLGALENGIDSTVSMKIFDKMEKFASYGFNKSHAAAYGYLTYVTAYLKANYPGEWMAALMTCDSDDLTKVAKFIRECQAMGIEMLPPDVNQALESFAATPKGIRFAMSGIKGIGTGVVQSIIEERKKRGPYKSLFDFCKRIDTKKVGKKAIEELVDAGCFDFTGWSRDGLWQSIDPMFETAMREQKDEAAGVLSLFSMLQETSDSQFLKEPTVKSKRSKLDILLKEKHLMGFFLTGHPLDAFESLLTRLSCISLGMIEEFSTDMIFRAAFIVETIQVKVSAKTQRKFAILMISDGINRYELPVWSDIFEEKSPLLKENQLLYAVLHAEKKDGTIKLSCKWLDNLSSANEEMILACDLAYDKAKNQVARFNHMKNAPKSPSSVKAQNGDSEKKNLPSKISVMHEKNNPVTIKIDADLVSLSHIMALKKTFESHKGNDPIELVFMSSGKMLATIFIDSKWGVVRSDKLHADLQLIESICR